MLKLCDYTVFHYGNELSRVVCDENIAVTNADDIEPPSNFLNYDLRSPVYSKFSANAIDAITKRKKPNDFLLCPWGAGHKTIADKHSDLIVVESGIGYPGGFFAPFKVFESYAMMHAYYGLPAVAVADKFRWYEVVIPNAFDPDDFIFSDVKDDYLLFLGMRHGGVGKGLDLAIHIAHDTGRKLIIAGSDAGRKLPDFVEHVGFVDSNKRAPLLAKARALLAPSVFLEPFCGVQIEAFLSGTPVISTDWGAFAEYNHHGVTGYRCRTHEQFVWAVNSAHEIDPHACRKWAENFTIDRVAEMYDEYFNSLMTVRVGRGWYEPNPKRHDLNWLCRVSP
jgi:glycosyltransferase involved in cell wall biosynthesis